jgi:hypothetical protein
MDSFYRGLRSLSGAVLVALIWLGLPGCGGKAPEPINPDTAADQVGGLFDQAPPEVKALADGAVQALANDNLPRAHMLLQTLAARNDLTPEQQQIVVGALIGVGQKLQETAAAGDEKAQEFQRLHQSSK